MLVKAGEERAQLICALSELPYLCSSWIFSLQILRAQDSKDHLLLTDLLLRMLLNVTSHITKERGNQSVKIYLWTVMKKQMWGGAHASTQERVCCALWSYQVAYGAGRTIQSPSLSIPRVTTVLLHTGLRQGSPLREMPAPDLPPMVKQRHNRLLSFSWEPERSRSSEWPNQAMHLSRGRQILVVWVIPREGELCHHPPLFALSPSITTRSSAWFSSGYPAARLGERWMEADGATGIESTSATSCVEALPRPQSLCHLCLGWSFGRRIPNRDPLLWFWLSKWLIPLSWNLQPHRQRISYSQNNWNSEHLKLVLP